ncbi:MAG: Mbeg1-like protein [Eubacterium sp.]
MKNLIDYIDEFGNFKFSQKPFNEIDNLIFSQLAYTEFKGIVGYDNSITLSEAAKRFFAIYNDDDIKELIGISAKSAQLLKKCSQFERYRGVILCHYINNVNEEIDKQFSAVHFILDNNIDVVAYRGTDVTVTGVKESAMLSYMFPVPAQIEALYYFQETCMKHKEDIILCGHSKGGNLAIFAAVNCSNSLKKRIIAVYEDDAPGFPKYFFDRYDYQQIKDKIYLFTPQCSIIGRMLYHDANPNIIHSSASGLKQHQASSWDIKYDSFVRAESYDTFSDFINDYLDNLLDYVSDEELELFFDTLEYVALNMGIEDFYDIKEIDIRRVFSVIDSFGKIEEGQKEKFKQILKKVSADFAKEYFSEKAQKYFDRFEKLGQMKENIQKDV